MFWVKFIKSPWINLPMCISLSVNTVIAYRSRWAGICTTLCYPIHIKSRVIDLLAVLHINFHVMKIEFWVIHSSKNHHFRRPVQVSLNCSTVQIMASEKTVLVSTFIAPIEARGLCLCACRSSWRQYSEERSYLQIMLCVRHWSTPWNCCHITLAQAADIFISFYWILFFSFFFLTSLFLWEEISVMH